MSQVLNRYPGLAPGLCGHLSCPRLCARSQHCPAGQRRFRQLLTTHAIRRFTAKPNRQQEEVCQQLHRDGLCPSLCNKCGGCFLPRTFDSQAELKRKAYRPQKVLDFLVMLRQKGAS